VKLRYKILNGLAVVVALGIAALLITVSHDSACTPIPPLAEGTEGMRAIMHRCYGAPLAALRIERIAKPKPRAGEVLIRVHASSANPAQWYETTGQPYVVRLMGGLGHPQWQRIGYDVAGVVEAVGPGVTRFKPGDEVFGGVGGAYAEYVLGRETGPIVMKPANLSFDEAAGIPIAAITALQGLRDQGHVTAGQKVLVNGASGGVGHYAVQIAKALGAEVTGVCSTRNVEMVRALGADRVIDYTREDFTRGPERYDVIVDNVGNHGFGALADVMNPHGIIVVIGGSKKGPFLGPIKRIAWSKVAGGFIDPHITYFIADLTAPDLQWLADLARDGRLKTVIDRRYPLAQAATALDYLGGGHARGKVIIGGS
jgi:NADPH:quinone reductase-like Zn-dependent oxidoreductase